MARRDALSKEAQQRAACLITERLLGHQWFYRAQILLCYASYGSELDTYELIEEALRLKKKIYLPRVLPKRQMAFYQIESLDELQPGFHGILQPPESCRLYRGMEEAEVPTLMVMPGVAYDPYGYRLGYGGGYYDRYLAAHPWFLTHSIGIGHGCQLVEKLPVEETDCKPYQVILV